MPAVARTELDANALEDLVSRKWDEDIVPHLVEYIRIPCKSPHFDADCPANRHTSMRTGWPMAISTTP
jgi:hypothetical protein